jgi:hypothetical protein
VKLMPNELTDEGNVIEDKLVQLLNVVCITVRLDAPD